MSDFSYERLEQSIKNLKLDISIEELATWSSVKISDSKFLNNS